MGQAWATEMTIFGKTLSSIESYKDSVAGQNGLFGLLTFGRSPGSERSGCEGGVRKLGYTLYAYVNPQGCKFSDFSFDFRLFHLNTSENYV